MISKSILVVDDDAAILSLLKDALTFEGYKVTTATNGQDALTQVERQQPDLIILDVLMPVMDGAAFCAALRETEQKVVPVVALTASFEPCLIQDRLGCKALLRKPFDLEHLLQIVQQQLS